MGLPLFRSPVENESHSSGRTTTSSGSSSTRPSSSQDASPVIYSRGGVMTRAPSIFRPLRRRRESDATSSASDDSFTAAPRLSSASNPYSHSNPYRERGRYDATEGDLESTYRRRRSRTANGADFMSPRTAAETTPDPFAIPPVPAPEEQRRYRPIPNPTEWIRQLRDDPPQGPTVEVSTAVQDIPYGRSLSPGSRLLDYIVPTQGRLPPLDPAESIFQSSGSGSPLTDIAMVSPVDDIDMPFLPDPVLESELFSRVSDLEWADHTRQARYAR